MEETPPWYRYPNPEEWENASVSQRKRSKRILMVLESKRVPVLPFPFMVFDEEEACMQTAQATAQRTMVLWAIALRADQLAQDEVMHIIHAHGLSSVLSEEEEAFLYDKEWDEDNAHRLEWRLECIWVFLWALGYVEEIPWPGQMCDVAVIAGILKNHENNPDFITKAKLVPTEVLLDQLELSRRLHWALRNAMIHQRGVIPANLDWASDAPRILAIESTSVGVVEQRHHAFSWLTDANRQLDWDDVDTPT